MKELLNEIKNQPEHIRKIFMWVCVIIVFSIIGFGWFRTTQKQFANLLNPSGNLDAVKSSANKVAGESEPFFGGLFSSLKNFSANIGELFSSSSNITAGGNTGAARPTFSPLPPKTPPLD
ncbi:MAG: hypothetical protein CEN90_740 [Parcubacteria group bacterium Licking1014_17]|nr:MAG: hypothetical protein CEN90_740 [Parcubacteria group bacterium Licking1014_17]